MLYRLPEISDKSILQEYMQEHYDNKETSISASLGLPASEYDSWVEKIHRNAFYGDEQWGKSLLYLCFDNGKLIGLLSIRYELPGNLTEKYGDIGYGVRPSERNKGYGTTMLRYALSVCKEKGMDKVLLGCYKDNIASASTIKKNGGVLIAENDNYNEGRISQYYSIKLQLEVPSKIKALIDEKPFIVDNIGMSGNKVLIFEDMVLKIEDGLTSMAEQVQLMKWLEEKIPVPQVLEYEEENGKCYLLMSRIGGEMSCDTYYLEHPNILLEALSCGLKMLWEVNIQECPRVRDLETMLKEARIQVENNLVDLDNVEPTTFGEDGFRNPKHLLEWLENNRPSFEPVFSHGDYCLPNVFLENGHIKGFIDLDKAGICDKWNDIALCYRSLKHNFGGLYGGKVYEDFKPEMLFEILGIEPDWEKINYFLLLDELF